MRLLITFGSIFLILILFAVTGFFGSAGDESNQSQNLSTHAFEHKLNENNVVLLDIRTAEEVKGLGKIKGAENIDYYKDGFVEKVKALETDKPVLLYCASGNRSGQALSDLEDAGFDNVYHLKHGFNAWEAEELPVHKD